MNRIHRLEELGQSAWLDFIDRDLLLSGQLQRMIAEDGLRGVTSNPTIFQKAIASSSAYDDLIAAAPPNESDASVLERVMVRDLTLACDNLRSVYRASNGADGFASIEVAPTLAGDTGAQVEQARRMWAAVDRPNLMVKIPGTRAGLPAIERCVADGLNINVTLLFSLARYREVLDAHLRGLERRAAAGERVDVGASVASFFVSRVDTKVDKLLDALPNALCGAAGALRGQIAIANARIAYEEYERVMETDRWKALAAKGARPQRLLWASTSSKDPLYPDTYYVEGLIGPNTVDTMTLETFRAYLDHGQPEVRIRANLKMAHRQMHELAKLQIDLAKATEQLENEGVASFSESFQRSLRAIAQKRKEAVTAHSHP